MNSTHAAGGATPGRNPVEGNSPQPSGAEITCGEFPTSVRPGRLCRILHNRSARRAGAFGGKVVPNSAQPSDGANPGRKAVVGNSPQPLGKARDAAPGRKTLEANSP